MKTKFMNLVLSLILAAVILPLSAHAGTDKNLDNSSTLDGVAASGTVDPHANPVGVTDCPACDAARAAASVGGTIADTPTMYDTNGAAAVKGT